MFTLFKRSSALKSIILTAEISQVRSLDDAPPETQATSFIHATGFPGLSISFHDYDIYV